MLSRTLRNSRARFTSVSTPLFPIRDVDEEMGEENSADGAIITNRTTPRPRLGFGWSRGTHGLIPLGGDFIVLLALLLSLLFIFSISLTFSNANDANYFTRALDQVASVQPGLVLIGEDVDVDINEPAVTVRWTIAGCGEEYVLSGSPMLHGSSSCGLFSMPMEVFVDSASDPVVKYNPKAIPIDSSTGQPLLVQNLIQFDSGHTLDVHAARFYPFDTYTLTTSLRVTASNKSAEADMDIPLAISALPIVHYTSSFMHTSFVTPASVAHFDDEDNTDPLVPVSFVEVRIRRPGPARAYAMLLFGMNWVLAHGAFGLLVLAKLQSSRVVGDRRVLVKDTNMKLAGVLVIALVIPQLRAAIPDGPGFDGVLIDTIGYLPQLAFVGISALLLLMLAAARTIDYSYGLYPMSTIPLVPNEDTEGWISTDSQKKDALGGKDEGNYLDMNMSNVPFGSSRGVVRKQL